MKSTFSNICDHCESKSCVKNQNLCSKHYAQIRVHGKIRETRYNKNKFREKEGYLEMILVDFFGKEKDVTKVDKTQKENLLKYKWHLTGHGYAACKFNGKNLKLHHFILGKKPNKGYDVDHINRNRLDNRISNLRIVTRSENLRNNGNSNIHWRKEFNSWAAQVTRNYKKIHLGLFKEKNEALIAVAQFKQKEYEISNSANI